MELWEATVSDLQSNKGLFCRFTRKQLDFYTAYGDLFLALYNLTMHDKLHDSTS